MAKILVIKGCLSCPYNRNVAGHSYCGGYKDQYKISFKLTEEFLNNELFIDERCPIDSDNTLAYFLEEYVNETGYGMDMWSKEEDRTISKIINILKLKKIIQDETK